MKLIPLLLVLALLAIKDVEAQETKLDLNVLFDVANIMATTSWKPFCITVLTDLIVEVNNKKDNNVPLMILDFETSDTLLEKAQVSCPNLIIGTHLLKC